jgi:hypothetical protein
MSVSSSSQRDHVRSWEQNAGRDKISSDVAECLSLVFLCASAAWVIGNILVIQLSTGIVVVIGGINMVIGTAAAIAERREATAGRTTGRVWRVLGPGLVVFGLFLVLSATLFRWGPFPDDSPITKAKVDVMTLTKAAEAFNIQYGAYPNSLQALVNAPSGKPFVEAEALMGPWGPYQYDPRGRHNDGKRPDIWTVSPHGKERIANWMLKK